MVFKHAIRRTNLMALLLVVSLTASVGLLPFGSGPLGPEVASADSRCHQHYSHTHYTVWPATRTDEYSSHGTYLRPATNQNWHWIDHENSVYRWCFRDENGNGIDD